MDVRDVIVRMAQEGPSHSKAEQPLGEMAQKGPSFSETEQPLGRRMEDISDEIS